jgi:endo-1,4-beta-xylanase
VKRWKKNGIPITCVGTQTHIEISHETTPKNVRDFAKALAELGITLNITELDIGFPKGSANSLSAKDYQKQGHLYRQFMDVFLEEPNMGEFMIWGVTDAHSWLDGSQGKTQGLIYDKQYKPKPAYDSLIVSLKAHAPSEVVSPYSSNTPESSSSTDVSSSSSTITIKASINYCNKFIKIELRSLERKSEHFREVLLIKSCNEVDVVLSILINTSGKPHHVSATDSHFLT